MTEWIVPVLVAIVAAIPGILALRQGRRKVEADAAQVYEGLAVRSGERWQELMKRVDALELEVKKLTSDNVRLAGENNELKVENETLRCEVGELRSEVDSLRQQLERRRK